MGKRYFRLYEKICHPLNLWSAYKKAARGKRYRPAAAAFEFELEDNLATLHDELCSHAYQPGTYYSFMIHSPKKRLVNAAPFRDRVVHHALMNVIEPLFERKFIHDSYANRIGKGTHKALDRCTCFLRRHKYVMHLDVRQFFPSIDHAILKTILAKTVTDEEVLHLIDKILASGADVQSESYEMVYFPGDDLFARYRPRGLPIGNLTSQHWANVYLNELDQYVKRVLKAKAYLRYVDDCVLFANEKQPLHEWRLEIIDYLSCLRLTLHENRSQPRPVQTGLPFLGFVLFPDHRRLKQRNGIAFRRRLVWMAQAQRAGSLDLSRLQASLSGWLNHVRYGDTWGLRRAVLASANLLVEGGGNG